MANTTNYSFAGDTIWEMCFFHNDEIPMTIRIPSNVHYINFLIGLIFNIFLTVSTIFLNSVTILAYAKSALLKSKKPYFLIMLLSVNDLLVGLFGNGSFVIFLVTLIIGYARCEINILFHYACFCSVAMSIMTLFGLNIERYLSILHPFYHRTKVTKPKLLKMIVGLWILIVAPRLTSLALGKFMNVMVTIVFALNAFSTLYIYVAIYLTVRRRARMADTRDTGEQIAQVRETEGRINKKREQQNVKMAKSCAVIVGVVLTCNIPFTLYYTLPLSNMTLLFAIWSTTIALIPSTLNSLIFFWNNSDLRKEALKLFKNLN